MHFILHKLYHNQKIKEGKRRESVEFLGRWQWRNRGREIEKFGDEMIDALGEVEGKVETDS